MDSPSIDQVRALMRRQQAAQAHRRAKPARRHHFLWEYTYEHAQHREDTMFWFLPAHPDEVDPIVAFVQHNIRSAGWSYRQPCTGCGFCPVCEYRTQQDPTFRLEADRHRYASNVLVYRDPVTPGNDWKVGMFEFGAEIHDIVMGEIENGINVFDPTREGTLFRLRAAWHSPKAVPKYRSESYALFESPGLTGPLQLRHRLRGYPPVHDEEELRYQFLRTMQQSLQNETNPGERVGDSTENPRK